MKMLCFYDNILSSVVVQAKDGDSSHDVPFSKQRELTSLSLCRHWTQWEVWVQTQEKWFEMSLVHIWENTAFFFPLSSVINCNFKSISCLTMDCFVHQVFFLFFFCLFTDLLHLLIWATPDTNENCLAVWSRFSSLTVRSEFFSMLQKTFIFWLFVLDFQAHY